MASLRDYPSLSRLMADRPAPESSSNNGWLGAGISSGIDKFQALSGVGLRAVGDAIGSQTVSDIGAGIAQRNFAEAEQNGRPDLESFPTDDWSKIPEWAGYQVASQVPNLLLTAAAMRFGGGLAARFAPQAAVRAGAAAPVWLGGGGLRAGMTAAEAAAAQAQGARLAAGVLAQAPINYPQAVGSMYNEAVESGNAGPGAAAAALAGGVPYSLMEGFEPPVLGKMLAAGATKGVLKRVATGAAVNAAQETVTEGVQTAMEQAFRPDLPVADRLANVVEGALTGGFIGGVFGGAAGAVGGVRSLKRADPAQTTNDDLKAGIDADLDPNKGQPVGPAMDPSAVVTEPNGQVRMAEVAPRGEARPFANLKDEELALRMEVVQQQMREAAPSADFTAQQDFATLFGAQPPLSRENPNAAITLQQLRREMDIRQGVPVDEAAPDFTAGAGVKISDFPLTPAGEEFDRAVQGPFGSEATFTPTNRVSELDTLNERINNGIATAQDLARARMLAEGEVKADTSANTGLGTDRTNAGPNDLFRNQNMVLDEQLTPEEAKRRSGQAAQYTAEQQAARDEVADKFFGSTTAEWARNAKQSNWTDEIDLIGTVIEEIDRRDASNKTLPQGLRAKAAELGLMTKDGAPRDLQAEIRAADAKNNQLMEQARLQGTQQALAKAAQFQKSTLKPLLAQKAALDAAQQRLAARAQTAAQPSVAPTAPSAQTILGIQPTGLTAADVQELNGAPLVPVAPTFAQNFARRGSITPVNVTPAPTVEVEATGPVRDASGTRYQTLGDRFRNGGGNLSQATPSTPMTTQVVTSQTKPKRGAKVDPVQQVARNVEENRQTTLRRLEAVANDTQLDEIGRQDLRQQAASVAQTYAEGRPGADAEVNRILAEHSLATGGVVFSTRPAGERLPPMSPEALNKAMEKIAKTLPPVARETIVMVPTAADLPPVVQQAMQKQGMHPTDVRGVLHDGKVYVVEGNIGSEAELNEVIQHELFGHGGVRALLGKSGNKVLLDTWSRMGGFTGFMSLARKFNVEKAIAQYIPGADPKTGVPTRELTANEQIALVDELLAQVQGTSGRLGTMLRTWAGQFKKMLIDVLRGMGLTTLADRMDTFGPNELAMTLSNMRRAVESGASIRGDGTQFLRLTPEGMNESLQNFSVSADTFKAAWNKIKNSEKRLELNKFHLKTSTIGNIVDLFGKMFEYKNAEGNIVSPLKNLWDAYVMRGVAEQRVGHATANTYNKFEAAVAKYPKVAEHLSNLMKLTFDKIDPRKSWAEHTWLQSEKDPAVREANRKKVEAANELYRKLSNERNNEVGRETLQVYEEFIASNEAQHFAQHAMSLYNIILGDKEISQEVKDKVSASGNPMDGFLKNEATYDNAMATRDYWKAEARRLYDIAADYLDAQGKLTGVANKVGQVKIDKNNMPLKARLATIKAEQESMRQAPYFHLGRFGDWVMTFSIRTKGKVADPSALEAIAKRFHEAGIDGIEIPVDATRPYAYVRFETKEARDAALDVARDLAKQGYVLNEGDKLIGHHNRRDEKTMNGNDFSQNSQWAQTLLEQIRATEFGGSDKLTDEQKALVKAVNSEFERHITQYFLDLLPDTSLSKVLVQRKDVPGFSTDMIRSHLFRNQVGGRALANLYAAGRMSEARSQMIKEATEARYSLDSTQAQIKQNVVNELFLRESQRPLIEKNSWIDVVRAVNHAYFLGMSPSYVAVNMTQIGVLLWPELAKRHGFVNSAKAIAKVTPTALKVLKFVWKDALARGLKNLPDASINTTTLKNANITGAEANFIMRIVNSGILDIGSQTREVGRIAEGQRFSKLDQSLRWASAFGYYSEMLSRLIAALSARELHGGTNNNEEMYKYVDTTVRQSMLSYETWNQARATGKMGLLGEYTPIMTSLMQYTFQLTEKLYREFDTAFMNSDLDAKEKAAARRFLGGHLAAIVTLTGTLGMPMMSAFAGVFDLLANSIWKDKDDEPMNIRVAYRNLLTDMFGDTAGDVIARGLPRAVNIDLSSRAGEQDLIPYAHMFSKLLTDKREWKDKVEEDTFRMLGAPLSMVNNVMSGASQFMNGNHLDGMIEFMPTAIKGPLKAAKLMSNGYTDQKGNRIPIMTRGTSDVIWQALGFNPAQNAEYQESKNDQRILRGAMTNKAKELREDLAVAIESGDMDKARDLTRQAMEFDAKNPDFKVMKSMSQVLRSRARERLRSQRSGAPLGVKPGLADRTRYGIAD